jgi:Protein of unknown function (DUF2800)
MLRPSSKYAREGTAAHKVAELTLQGDIFLPDKITVEGHEYVVSRGMCQALNGYVSHVQALRALPGAVMILEKRLVVPHTFGMVWGTLDCGVHAGDLHVVDLKYGKGHVVAPDAPQLKLYALALAEHVMEHRGGVNVTLTICQPRAGSDPVRSHRTKLGELVDWRQNVVQPAVLSIRGGDTLENAGPHCRWCVRRSECAAFARLHQNRAASAFDDEDLF